MRAWHLNVSSGRPLDAPTFAAGLGDRGPALLQMIAAERALDEPPAAEARGMPRVFGRYTLLSELGRGTAGIVYEAVDRELGRTVALKVLRVGVDRDPRIQKRFAAEARAIARVRHPAIVEVYDHGEVEGQWFYSMTLVPGPTLAAAAAGLALDDILRGACELVEALGVLHAAGVLHRDVKPQNIILDGAGRWILADFGLARLAGSPNLTGTHDLMGTPNYMSPEQIFAENRKVDVRSDIYGVGATLYQVACGRPPFLAEDMAALLGQVRTLRPDPPSQTRPALSKDFDRVVMKCLEKRQEDRYPDTSSLLEDLQAMRQGRSVQGRPVSTMRRVARAVRRRPWWIAAALLVSSLPLLWSREAGVEAPSSRQAPVEHGWISLDQLPGALISIDGGPFEERSSPIKLAAGTYQIRLRSRQFVDMEWSEVVLPGVKSSLKVLDANLRNPADVEASKLLGAALQLDVGDLQAAEMAPAAPHRAGVRGKLSPIAPRGAATSADLQRMLFEWDIDVPDGQIVFLDELSQTAEPFFSMPFDPEAPQTWQAFPEAVRLAASPGRRFYWGLEAAPESGVRAKRDLARFAAVEVIAAGVQEPDEVLAIRAPAIGAATRLSLEVQALLAAGRPSAALARLARAQEAGEDVSWAAGFRRVALRRAFDGHLDVLEDAPSWRRANEDAE